MTSTNLTRRRWLIAMGALGFGKPLNASVEALLSGSVNTELNPPDAHGALERLKKGNRRFMEGVSRHAHESASWRSLLTKTQKPFATVLACSDSRAPPELIFDVGLGDLFTIRLAGNIIAADVIGTIQYGVAHLHTPLLVVLGHEGCGAVDATLEEMLHKPTELKYVGALHPVDQARAKGARSEHGQDRAAERCRRGECPVVDAAAILNAGRGTGATGKTCKPGRGRVRAGDRAGSLP